MPDLASPEFKADPHPFYSQLRAQAPVFPYTVRRLGQDPSVIVSRYTDVLSILKDARFGKQRLTQDGRGIDPWVPGFLKPLQRNMLDLDAPDHTRLRGLVHKAFTPRLIDQMRDKIQTITDELLDAAQERGQMDLIHDFALPLPVTIIADMLGVPPEDRHKFHRWSNAAIASTAS